MRIIPENKHTQSLL